MDDSWTAFEGVAKDMRLFIEKFVPDFFLRPEVNSDIQENFRVIRKLLEHSYFEYKFYDLATLKSMLTMEMALKIRYREINGSEWEKDLKKLIDWFVRHNYFEVYNAHYLDSLRDIRNLMAHPYQHTCAGPSSSHLITNIIDLVNGLYEDPVLRLRRMRTTQRIINLLNSFNFNEGVKVLVNRQSYMVHRAWPGFLNNKSNREVLYFYYKPCFDLTNENFDNNQWGVSPTELFIADSFVFKRDSFLLKNASGEELLIAGITDEKEQEIFKLWLDKYQKFTQPTGDYLFTHTNIAETFLMHLRAFHKI